MEKTVIFYPHPDGTGEEVFHVAFGKIQPSAGSRIIIGGPKKQMWLSFEQLSKDVTHPIVRGDGSVIYSVRASACSWVTKPSTDMLMVMAAVDELSE
jgi:hypothetical protein